MIPDEEAYYVLQFTAGPLVDAPNLTVITGHLTGLLHTTRTLSTLSPFCVLLSAAPTSDVALRSSVIPDKPTAASGSSWAHSYTGTPSC